MSGSARDWLVRTATLAELGDVLRVGLEAFDGAGYPLFALRQFFDLFSDSVYVCEDRGEICGFALFAAKDADTAWVLAMGVANGRRGHGIGDALLRHGIAHSRGRGLVALLLTVAPDNPALRLYQRHGFREIARHPSYFGGDSPRLVMERRLTEDA